MFYHADHLFNLLSRQLRIWNRFPDVAKEHHAEACGEGWRVGNCLDGLAAVGMRMERDDVAHELYLLLKTLIIFSSSAVDKNRWYNTPRLCTPAPTTRGNKRKKHRYTVLCKPSTPAQVGSREEVVMVTAARFPMSITTDFQLFCCPFTHHACRRLPIHYPKITINTIVEARETKTDRKLQNKT